MATKTNLQISRVSHSFFLLSEGSRHFPAVTLTPAKFKMPLLKINPCCGCIDIKGGLKICSIAKMVFDLFSVFLVIYGVYKCAERLDISLRFNNEIPQAIVSMSLSGLVFLFVLANLVLDIVLFCSVDNGELSRMEAIFRTLVGFTVVNLAFSLVLVSFAVFDAVEKVGLYACSVAFVAACVSIYTLWVLSAHVKNLRMYAPVVPRPRDATEATVTANGGYYANSSLPIYEQPQEQQPQQYGSWGQSPKKEFVGGVGVQVWVEPPPPYAANGQEGGAAGWSEPPPPYKP